MLLALLALLLLRKLFGLSSFPLLLAGNRCLALLAVHIAEVKVQQCQCVGEQAADSRIIFVL
jgi:hypothetical protein